MQIDLNPAEVTAILRGLSLLYKTTGAMADASRSSAVTAGMRLTNMDHASVVSLFARRTT